MNSTPPPPRNSPPSSAGRGVAVARRARFASAGRLVLAGLVLAALALGPAPASAQADTAPHAFNFLNKSGPPSTVVTSDEITVAGLGTSVSVTAQLRFCRFLTPDRNTRTTTGAACTLVKNGADVSGSSTTVANGDKVKIKVTSNSTDGGHAQVRVDIGTGLFSSAWFTVTTVRTVDTTPDPFSFLDKSGPPSTVVTSNEITVAGVDGSVTARFSSCRFVASDRVTQTTTGAACTLVKNGTDVSGSSTTVANGDKVKIKVTSNSADGGQAQVKVYIGTLSDWFTVTTAADTTPDPFSFTDQSYVAPSTVVTSNEITVAGLGTSVTARFNFCRFEAPVTRAQTTTGAACTLVKNGTDVSGSSTTVANGDKIAVKVTSHGSHVGRALVRVYIGTGTRSSWFRVATWDPMDTTPDVFSFARQFDVAPSTVVTSNEITVAGIDGSVTARFNFCRFEAPVTRAQTTTGAACTLVKNGTDVSGSSTTVANGDRIAVKVTSNSAGSGGALVKVDIGTGGYSYSWFIVTTAPTVPAPVDTTPDPFSFTRQSDAAPGTVVTSNEITVAGLGTSVSARIGTCRFGVARTATNAACTLVKNGADVSGSSTTVANGDRIAVKVTSDSVGSGSVEAIVGIGPGAYSTSMFVVTTRPTVTLALSPASISESGGVSRVTATLSGASSEAVTVTVSAAAVAPAMSGDFALSSATTLTIAAGSTRSWGKVTIAAVDNSDDEPNKEVTVSGTASGGNGVAAPSSRTLTLIDDDGAPNAELSLNPASISENGGASSVSATLSHPSSAATTVTVTPVTGSYTVGSDATIVIAAGETANATDTAAIAAVNNTTDEPDRTATVTATLTNSQGAGTASGATLTLEDDDDAPGVTLSVASSSIPENGGSTTVSATLTHPSSAATTVTVTPVADAYSVASGSGATIVVAAGSTTSTDTAAITAVDNDVDAADNAVTVAGTAQNSQGAGTVTGASLTIADDDTAGFAVSPSTSASLRLRTTESGGTAAFSVKLATEPTGDVVLGVASSDTGEGAVSPSSLTFTASDWSTARTVTLTGVDDAPLNPADGDQDYTVTLTVNTTSTVDARYDALPAVTVHAVNADNEHGLDVSTVTGRATEAGGTATFTVALVTQPSQPVTVTVSSRDASEGAASPSSLTFATTAWNTARTVTVTGADDTIDDGEVTWAVRLDPSSGDADYNGLANVDVPVTTTDDDDAPGVTLSLSPSSISENGGAATVTATLSRASGATTTVTVTPVTGFYTVGSDATIVIAAGQTANATDTATIAAVDNDTDAPDRAGAVTATIANARATADGTTMAVSGGALTVTDDDNAPNAALSLNPASISENGGASAVSATLTHPSSAATTVTVTPVTGSYTVGSDVTIVIAAGQTANATDTAAIAAVDNATDEPDRTATVTATLTNSQGAGTASGATLTLEDDDDAPGVTLSVASPSIPENGGSTTVSATLTHPSSAATTVTVTPVSGFYTVGSDATITIAAGSTANAPDTATIAAVNDDMDNVGNRSVTVTGTASNGQGAGTVSGASLTIADDDTAGFAVSPLPSTSSRLRTTESGGTASFTVKLASEPTGNVVLGVASSDTTEGTVSASSLTFTATDWSTAQTVTLTGVDDAPANPADGDRDYTVTLTVNTTSTVDANYDGLPAVTVYAVNADNEYGLDVSSVTGRATEAGGQATFTVELLAQPSQAVTVTVSSLDASEGAASPSSLTFATTAWNTARTVTVTGADDTIDDGEVTWAVRLDPSSGDANYNGLANVDVSVTTTDDDAAPGVTLALSPATISENGGAATVTATLSRASGAATTVTVTPVSGFYTVSDATIVIAAGQTANASDTATIAAVDNDTDAPDRAGAVTATITNDRATADGTTMAVSGGALTIGDDDAAPNATLSLNPASVSENGGAATVTATLSHPSSAATTVTVTPVSGSYTVGSDATIVIAAGATANATDTAAIAAADNTKDEPDRTATVTATLTNSQGAGTVTGATLTLTDDDAAPGVTLTVASPSIPENGGSTTVSATLTHPSSAATTVTVTAVSGSYTVGSDATITIAAGLTANATDTATIAAVNDDMDNAADRSVTVTGTASNGQGAGSVTGASLTLTDDDTAGFVLSPSTSASLRLRTTESGGTAAFSVKLATEPTGDVVLGVASSDTGEGAVSPSSLTFTASDWSTARTVTLTGVDDAPANPADGDQDYTVTLTVNMPSTADTKYDALSAVTVYAVNADNEYGLDVSSVTGQATEAGGTATFTVALATRPSQAVTVSVTSRDASEGAASPSSLTFATTAWNTAQTVTVTGADDTIDDGEVTWAVRLDPSSGDANYNGLANVDVSVTTTDDDAAPGVTLALSPATISENGGAATVTATLSRASGAATTVTVTPVSGFYTVSDATIVIAAGQTANASDTATIAAVDNDTDAPDRAGAVTATITNDRATADGTTMAVSGGALTIGDDDAAPNATLSLNPASVSENGGAATVTATLSHPSSAATTVTVTPVSGSYTVGSDATIVIAAGATANATDTAAIAAADNTKDEPDRTATVTATLTNSQGAGTVTGATLTLTDDDAAPGVTLTVASPSIPENGGSTTVSATLTHPSSAATTVTVTAVSGSYTVGSDATITIAAGLTANATDTATIAAVNDDMDNAADRSVTVTGTASNGQGAGSVTGASLTLTDDDTAGFVLSPSTSASLRLRTTESGGTAAFSVKLATEPTGDVVLGVASSDTGEGTVSASSLTFTASDWSTAQTVTLTGVDDAPANPADGDQDYTVTLTVNMPSTADTKYDALSAVTVYAVNADNEYGLDVSSVTGQATEAGGTATFTVALATRPSQAVTVSVTSRDASEGAASPSSLTFATTAWNTARTVTVTGADDTIDDGEVTWAVRLDPSSGDANYNGLANVDVPVTTTDDDAAPGVTLALSPATIDESGASNVSTVTATLSRASSAATTVTVTPVSGFYTAGSDAVIVIAAGQTANASDTATIAAVDNDTDAPDRAGTVTATIVNARATADGTTMAVSGGALTVTDDDAAPNAALSLNPASVSENGGASAVSATLTHPSSAATTVTVTAVSGALYTVGSDATIVIAAGSTAAASDTAAIAAVDDDTHQGSGGRSTTVTATLTNSQGAGTVTGAPLTLTDDETLPTVALALSPASIAEAGGVSTVTATLSGASSAAVTITVSAAAGAGAIAADFALSSATTLTIASGSTTSAGAVTVTANDNTVASGSKQVAVSATAAGGNGVAAPSSATLTITDDDAPQTTLLLSSSSISENGGVATVTARLDRTSSVAVTVTVSAAAGAGAIAADFSLSSAKTLTIAAGSTTSAGAVTVTANDNDTDSPDKSVTVSGTASDSLGLANDPPSATLTLTDDEGTPTVTLALSPSSISENGGVSTVTATLDRASSHATTVTATAAAGFYTVSSPDTLTIAAGATGSTGTVTVTAANDAIDNVGNRSVTVTGTAENGHGVGAVTGASLTLTDDEALPTATLALSPASIDEHDGTNPGSSAVMATLDRASSEAVTLTVSAAAGTNAAAGDFMLSTDKTLTIAAGNTASSGTVTVTAVDNATDAPDKQVTVTAAVSGASGVAAPSSVTLTITDDEGLPTVTLALSPSSIPEDGGVSTVTAKLSHPSGAATTITVSAAPGTNAVSGDYTLSAVPMLVIAAGSISSSGTVTITAVDNKVDAADKTVRVTGTAMNSLGAGTVTGAELTIENDDEKGLAFARAEDPDFGRSRVLEVAAGSSASYTVALASEPTGPVTVTLVPSDRLAVTVNPASLTFTATSWNTAQTVTVTAAAGDGLADPVAPLSHSARDGGYDGVTGALSVAVADGTRIAVPAGSTTQIENIYVVNGQRVAVMALGVPAGVEIDLPSNLNEAVSMTFKPVGDEVPRESGSFSLAHGDERAMVDMNVVPMPAGGVKLCLKPPEGMREAAGRVSGRGVKLLRYTDGSWTAVTNSDLDDWDESRSRVCATVEKTSPFAAGYANTKPKFDTPQKDLVFTVDEEIDPVVTLPAATGGDGLVTYSIKERLPDELDFNPTKRTISGTPTAAQDKTTYTLVATDADNETALWKFTIEVKPALAEARARLKRINESVLPELSRAMWGSAVEAVTGRLESSGPGEEIGLSLARALRAQARDRAREDEERPWWREARERTREDEEGLSWRDLMEGRTFAVGLGAGGEGDDGSGSGGSGDAVVWGGGSRQSLSLDKAALDWSGDLFSAHMGFDGPLGENLRGGLAVSRFEGSIEYTDRSGEAAVAGVHESRMTAAHPYAGWSGPGGSRLWGALGYGAGEIEIVDAEVVKRFGVQKADSAFLAAALGGSVPVLSADGLTLALKASGEATRYSVDDNGEAIAKVSVGTHRLRLSAEGGRAYALPDGGTLAPSLELGVRWDGGDGETGAGVEAGGGLEWSLPGLTVAARGRTLAAHEGALKEWGAGGSVRLDPADGRGLSLRLEPRWGATESGLGRLWDEGVPGRPANGGDEARLETELGYGLPALGGAGVTTPYAGFGLTQGGEHDIRAGVRLGLGAGFDLGIEAERKEGRADPEHGVRLELRIRW